MLGGVRDDVRHRAGRRGHDRGEPRLGRRRRPRGALAAAGVHPRLASACSRPCRTCSRRSSAPTIPSAIPLVVGWARDAGPRGQPRPHLRHAGGVARRLAAHRSSARIAQRPDHISRLRAHRRGRHEARPADPPRRGRRSPTTTCRPTCTSSPTTLLGAAGLRLVRGEQLGDATPRTARGTTSRYWRGDDWWGVGPGAHSHVGGVRWWNVKHPAAYAERVAAGVSPAAGRETARRGRRASSSACCSRTRIREGLAGRRAARRAAGTPSPALIADGLVDGASRPRRRGRADPARAAAGGRRGAAPARRD